MICRRTCRSLDGLLAAALASGGCAPARDVSHSLGSAGGDADTFGATAGTSGEGGSSSTVGSSAGGWGAGAGGTSLEDASFGGGEGDAREEPESVEPTPLYLAPRVVFAGEPRRIRIFGRGLGPAGGLPVFVDSNNVGALIGVANTEGDVILPGLAEGEHFLRIRRPGADAAVRFVTVARTRYEDTDMPVFGRILSIVADEERHAFFTLQMSAGSSGSTKLSRLQFDGMKWTVADAALAAPVALTMTPDGRELLVLNPGCLLVHVNPDTLALGANERLPSDVQNCSMGWIDALADGVTIFAAGYWAQGFDYPTMTSLNAPSLHTTVSVPSAYQTRLLWAEGPTTSGAHEVFSFDVVTQRFTNFRTIGGDYYVNSLAVSGDGDRITHYGDVYDRALQPIGRLDTTQSPGRVGLSGDGAVAVAFVAEDQSLRAYDVRGSAAPFPPLAPAIPFPADPFGAAEALLVDDDGRTAFAFTIRRLTPTSDSFDLRFVVRRVRDP
jgi:hypothetical protein